MAAGFASLPILLNIVQLVGWGTFELVVMRDATVAIGRQSGLLAAGWWPVAATLLWGGVVALLISGSMVRLVRRVIARVALPLVVLSLLWLSWQFLSMARAQGLEDIWQRRGDGGMGVMAALDLVMAMPVSWLPLVADYARHGVSGAGALRGSWLGYALANIWCYCLGVLVALTLPSQDLVTALLLAQGGLLALSLILIDEVDNAYGDVVFGGRLGPGLRPGWSVSPWGRALAVLAVLAALVLPMHSAGAVLAAAQLGLRAAVRRDPGAPGVWRGRAAAATGCARRAWPYRWRCGWSASPCFHAGLPLWPTLGSGLPTWRWA